jgi:cation transport regulator ChaC
VGYRVREADVESVRAYLDYREKDDYDPVDLALFSSADGSVLSAAALCYVGRVESMFEEESDLDVVAKHIAGVRGPSGANSEYCLNVQRALAKRHLSCPHVFEVASRLHHLL